MVDLLMLPGADALGEGQDHVLTDGEEWYSAEVVFDGKAPGFIAYAVNGYEDRAEAETDALKRARLA